MIHYNVIIIGGGAAGLMCAAEAAKRGRSTHVFDHATRIGNKIRASGGGRCNFTNLDSSPDNYVSANPHFCKSALGRYTPEDFLELIKKHRIQFHPKAPGQLFCDGPAQQIADMLVKEATESGAIIEEGMEVTRVVKDDVFRLETSKGEFECESLVMATGGLSYPTMGATGLGYEIAKKFGHKIVPTRPALDGFLFNDAAKKRFGDLPGLSVDAEIRCGGRVFAEPILFTHKGLSGPAALQASLYWEPKEIVTVNFAPQVPDGVLEYIIRTKARGSLQEPHTILARILPQRLADRFISAHLPHSANLAQVKRTTLEALAADIEAFQFVPPSTVGYDKAEVTKGGVDTRELSSKTMGSSKTKGLFFIGEVVDVTGQLGGYNFQWAWSSGWAAGQAV